MCVGIGACLFFSGIRDGRAIGVLLQERLKCQRSRGSYIHADDANETVHALRRQNKVTQSMEATKGRKPTVAE